METNSHFRNALVTQSERYLQHITPLSLSTSSEKRPPFMNKDFIEQLHSFFSHLLDHSPPDSGPLDIRAYTLLLQFSLAHGNMHLLMPLLVRYIDAVVLTANKDSLQIPCLSLLNKLDKAIIDLETQYAAPLSLRIDRAEGFSKPREELSGLLNHESINPESSDSIAYVSKEDCTVMDLILTEFKSRPFIVRKISVLKKADNNLSPHICLLFSVPSQYLDPVTHKPTDTPKLIELYAKYNNWTMDDWIKSKEVEQTDSDLPISCFDMTTEEWYGFETLSRSQLPYQCCVVKLIRHKKQTEAEGEGDSTTKTFSVYGLQLYGDIEPNVQLQKMSKALAEFHPLPSKDSTPIDSCTVILRLFAALISLVRNQILIINRNCTELTHTRRMYLTCFLSEPHLNLDNLSFLDGWNVFLSLERLANQFTEHKTLTLEIASQLIFTFMPFFVTFERQRKNKDLEKLGSKREALEHISQIINDSSNSDDVIASLTGVLETGVTILFPEQEERVERMLEGVKLASSTETYPPAQIQIVCALIHYFSTQGTNKLLGLPRPHAMDLEKEIQLDVDSILDRLSPLLNILYQRISQQIEAFTTESQSKLNCINITPLLSSLQSSILNWCYALTFSEKANDTSRNFAKILLCRYLNLVERELSSLLKLLNQHIGTERILDAFGDGLLSVLLPELVSALHLFVSVHGVRDYVLHSFQGFVHKFTELSHSIPKYQSTYCVTQHNPDCLLGKWERECIHFNYSQKEDNEVFSSPGAVYMVIEFDNRCNTESGYDQLEFSDKEGKKYKYSGRVGSNNWPFTVTIKGDILNFRYKSDGGEFMYKFTLSAYGAAVSLHWFRDLYMSLAALFGKFCGENLRVPIDSHGKNSLTEEEVILLKSDIGKSIFRGGLQKSRFMRSYSGMHQTNTSSDTLISQFLDQMINEEGTTKSLDFLQVCQSAFKQPRYGGYLADKAVRATFAALLWHSQEMREEIARFEAKKETSKISSLVTATYRLAESVRADLLAAKQVLIQRKEDSLDKSIDSDLPLVSSIDKARFLLKFAGLSRISETDKTSPKRSKLARKKSKLGISQVVEKDPCMEIILNFVKKDAYSLDRIQQDMEERAKSAQNRSLTYNFTRDFILFATQTPLETEPHHILSIYLTTCFKDYTETPSHYGGSLDGCGLDLESRVRESFYSLTKKLFLSTLDKNESTDISKAPQNLKFLLSILHHLFNNIWNDFDFSFIHEHQLPKLLYTTAVNRLSIKTEKPEEPSSNDSKVEEYLGWVSLIQFHSLSLQLSSRIQDTASDMEEQYTNSAILLFVDCIRELISSIRAGIEAVKQRESKKKREEEAREKNEKKEKGLKKDRKKEEIGDKETKEQTSEQDTSVKEKLIEATAESDAEPNPPSINCDTEIQLETDTSKGGTEMDEVKENEVSEISISEDKAVVNQEANGMLDKTEEIESENLDSSKLVFSSSDTLSPSKDKSALSDFTESQLRFGEENLTRNLCALGGLAPINPGHPRWSSADISIQMVICNEVLPLLLDVIRSPFLKSSEKTQLLSVSLLVRFICRVDPQLVDEVMLSINPNLHPPVSASPPGVAYIHFLTNLGTVFLQKHKLIQTTTVGHYLHELLAEQDWMDAYAYNLHKHLELLPHTADPSCIFHLLVVAGFPELPAFGMQVEIQQKNSAPLSGLMVQTKEGNSYEVILANSRSTKNFLEKEVKIKPSTLPVKDKTSLLPILSLATDCMRITDKSVEQLYVTFLLLKTITNYVQGDKSGEALHKILQSGVLDLFTKLACKPSGIDKKWQVPELEHLCIRSYQPDKHRGTTPSPPIDTQTKADSEKENSPDTPRIDERDPLGNIPDSIKANFFNLQTAFNCKLSVIRAAYEHTNQNESALIENVQRWLTDDKGFQVPENILEKAKNWEPLEDDPTPELPQEMDETLDKGLPKYTPIPIDNKEFTIAKDQDKSKNVKEILIPPDKSLENEYSIARKDSLELFYSLENDTIKRCEIKKLLSGLTILQARQTLFSLILHWNLEVPLCTAFLENMAVSRLFSLLQCAHRCLDEQKFDRMLDQLVTHISETTKKALAVEASKVLGPIKACTISKESPHPNSKTIVQSKIAVKNAIQYIISPDPQCCFMAEDTILFGSDSEFSVNRQEMSGAEFVEKKQVVILADTLHYKIKTPQLTNGWGWKIQVVVVTAGVLSCFDSACKLLERILSHVEESNLLPFASIWENLFTACCFHPNEERFKIVSLMSLVLRLFTTQNSVKKRTAPAGEVVSKPQPEQRIDLTLLRPLWNYYSKLIEEHEDEKSALISLKIPPIARMLTDLFTQVELSAASCGLERELLMSQVTDTSLDLLLQQGIQNVGLVSIAINSNNIAMEKFVQAKKEYKPSTSIILFAELPSATISDSELKRKSSVSSETSSDEDYSPSDESDWSL